MEATDQGNSNENVSCAIIKNNQEGINSKNYIQGTKQISSDEISEINEINNKCVDFILEDNTKVALKLLKKAFSLIENILIDGEKTIDYKSIIVIIHNIACCYQKLKKFEKCIKFLKLVIKTYENLIETKYTFVINSEYGFKTKNNNKSKSVSRTEKNSDFIENSENSSIIDNVDDKSKKFKYKDNKTLGDFILHMRFCAKFHLQMCAVLSQFGNHIEAIEHANKAAILSEDNIIKTYELYSLVEINKKQMSHPLSKSDLNNQEEIKEGNCDSYIEKMIHEEKIFECEFIMKTLSEKMEKKKSERIRYKEDFSKEFIQKEEKMESIKKISSKNDYLKYKHNIYLERKHNEKQQEVVKALYSTKQSDDWINFLNIGNIMYLAPLNYDDLDLESDPRFELLRDAVIEKIVMMTVAYFCKATEIRFLNEKNYSLNGIVNDSTDDRSLNQKESKFNNGEYWHYSALKISCEYLPSTSPIVRHYLSSYSKHFGCNMDDIPEDEEIESNIEIIKGSLDLNEDFSSMIFRIENNVCTYDLKNDLLEKAQKNNFEQKSIGENSNNSQKINIEKGNLELKIDDRDNNQKSERLFSKIMKINNEGKSSSARFSLKKNNYLENLKNFIGKYDQKPIDLKIFKNFKIQNDSQFNKIVSREEKSQELNNINQNLQNSHELNQKENENILYDSKSLQSDEFLFIDSTPDPKNKLLIKSKFQLDLKNLEKNNLDNEIREIEGNQKNIEKIENRNVEEKIKISLLDNEKIKKIRNDFIKKVAEVNSNPTNSNLLRKTPLTERINIDRNTRNSVNTLPKNNSTDTDKEDYISIFSNTQNPNRTNFNFHNNLKNQTNFLNENSNGIGSDSNTHQINIANKVKVDNLKFYNNANNKNLFQNFSINNNLNSNINLRKPTPNKKNNSSRESLIQINSNENEIQNDNLNNFKKNIKIFENKNINLEGMFSMQQNFSSTQTGFYDNVQNPKNHEKRNLNIVNNINKPLISSRSENSNNYFEKLLSKRESSDTKKHEKNKAKSSEKTEISSPVLSSIPKFSSPKNNFSTTFNYFKSSSDNNNINLKIFREENLKRKSSRKSNSVSNKMNNKRNIKNNYNEATITINKDLKLISKDNSHANSESKEFNKNSRNFKVSNTNFENNYDSNKVIINNEKSNIINNINFHDVKKIFNIKTNSNSKTNSKEILNNIQNLDFEKKNFRSLNLNNLLNEIDYAEKMKLMKGKKINSLEKNKNNFDGKNDNLKKDLDKNQNFNKENNKLDVDKVFNKFSIKNEKIFNKTENDRKQNKTEINVNTYNKNININNNYFLSNNSNSTIINNNFYFTNDKVNFHSDKDKIN